MGLAAGLVCLALVAILGAHQATAEAYARTASYEDQIVVRCADKNKAEVQILQAHTDVWHVGQETVDLRVDRRLFARVQKYFPDCHIVVSNVETFVQEAEAQMFPQEMAKEQAWEQEVIAQTMPKCRSLKECEAVLEEWDRAKIMSSSFLEKYHPYEEIKAFYVILAKEHPSLVKYNPSIGKTMEGRDMPAVHITASKEPDKKKFYMQCQIHAREWISGAVCMYLAKHLVTNYTTNQRVKDVLDNLEFVMVPMVNPDGIAFSWKHDRLWRKNRNHCRRYSSKNCGVDINRNFPLGYLHKDTSNMGAEDYPGYGPLSEYETQAVVEFFHKNAPIIGSIDWHSYGQLLLRPYGYSNASAPDEDFLVGLSNGIKDVISSVHGSCYTAEKSEDLYYCYGVAADWFYSNDASKYNKGYRSASICIELRDHGRPYGFLLPADQIIPTAEEVLPAVLYYAEQVLAKPLVYNMYTAALEPPFNENDAHPRHRG